MTVTTETVVRALEGVRERAAAGPMGYHVSEVTPWHVASHLTGRDPHGRPLTPTKDLVREVSNALRRLERTGRVWSRVTKAMERCKRHSRRKVCVRRRWYSTHVKEA